MIILVKELGIFLLVELLDVSEANPQHFEHIVDYEAEAHQLVLELSESLRDLLSPHPSQEDEPDVEHHHSVDSHIA